MFDQKVPAPRSVAKKGFNLEFRAMIDLTAFGYRPGAASPASRVFKTLHVGVVGGVALAHCVILFVGCRYTKVGLSGLIPDPDRAACPGQDRADRQQAAPQPGRRYAQPRGTAQSSFEQAQSARSLRLVSWQ